MSGIKISNISSIANIHLRNVKTKIRTPPLDYSNWVTRSISTSVSFNDVCWSEELSIFVAVAYQGSGSRVFTSPDGINWTARTAPSGSGWYKVIWVNKISKFIVVAGEGTSSVSAMYSSDGINWTACEQSMASLRSVCWSEELNMLVSVGTNGVYTSTNGITWTKVHGGSGWFDVCWSKELSLFVTVAFRYESMMYSSDGVNWFNANTTGSDWYSVCWSPTLSLFVAIDATQRSYATSSDGINWSYNKNIPDTTKYKIIWIEEQEVFIVAGSNSTTGYRILYSYDGTNWEGVSNVPYNSYAVGYSPSLNMLVAVGPSGCLMTCNTPL